MLRNLSEIGGINLVIDPSVPSNASVDLKLSQVPWDQVMDVVLKSAQLTYELDGPVLRVLTRDARTKELQAEAEQKRASQAAPDLAMRRIRLNYSPAADVKKLLEDARIVSDRGSVEVDERTNMVIVQDLPKNLADIELLIAELDKPEPQVEIEAKILQTNRDTARALGVQWGVNGRVAPELGNTTSLALPEPRHGVRARRDAGPGAAGAERSARDARSRTRAPRSTCRSSARRRRWACRWAPSTARSGSTSRSRRSSTRARSRFCRRRA